MAEEEFSAAGLAPTQAFILMSVVSRPGIPAGDIARELELSPSTITRMLDKMESAELVTRSSEGKLARIYPTPAGLGTGTAIKAAWGRMYARYAKILGKNRSAVLTKDLKKASSKLERQR